jgi:signal transduction histidine kinase/ligand-binding sensor domain-containing protein/DNA-binding response OmpR family regulator
MKRDYFVLFIIFFSSIVLESNSLIFNNISTSNGLKHNNISNITQDYKGFLWLATENGLHRYDGVDFEIYLFSESDSGSISGNVIYRIFEGADSTLWIATNRGLNRYNRKTNTFRRIPLNRGSEYNNEIVVFYYSPTAIESADEQIYVSWGNHGIWKLDKEREILNPVRIIDSLGYVFNMGNITRLFDGSDNSLWMGSKTNGLFRYFPFTGTTIHYSAISKQSIRSDFIFAINEDKYGHVLISHEAGIDVYNPESDSFSIFMSWGVTGKLLDITRVWQIDKDNEGNLWLCSNGSGLHKLTGRDFRIESFLHNDRNPHTLNDNNVQCFYEDGQGNKWVGTQRGGLNYALNSNASVFRTIKRNPFSDNTLKHNRVSAIYETKSSVLIIGTDGGGLNFYCLNSNKFISAQKAGYNIDCNDESILAIHLDEEENLWVGGFLTGLKKYGKNKNEHKKWQHSPLDSLSLGNNDVRQIISDSLGRIWIATNGGGVNLFDEVTDTFKRFTASDNYNSISSNFTLTITEDSNGYIWIGTYEGMCRICAETFAVKRYTSKEKISEDWIYSIKKDSKNQLWVGTNMSVYKYDYENDFFIDYSGTINLSNEIISDIVEDDSGNLWFSTSNGLAKYNPQTGNTNFFYATDGLPSSSFINAASHKNSNGIIYFGTSQGLIAFNPDEIIYNNSLAPVYITDISYAPNIDDKYHVSSKSHITLNYKQASSITFNFAAINLINAEQNKYSWQLQGFDEKWSDPSHSKRAFYTNLSPGKYIFRVIASNNDNVWNYQGDYIEITITPPFWKLPIAFVLYTLVIVMLLYLIWRYSMLKMSYAENIKIEKLKVEKVNEIARIKSEFFINISHELSTPLTLILSPIEKLLNDDCENKLLQIIKNNASQMLKLINELIDSQKAEENRHKLEYSFGNIVPFLQEVINTHSHHAERNNIKLYYKYSQDAILFRFDANAMEKIMNNLLSNAIKYNRNKGSVTIEVKHERDALRISVSDTGIGMDADKLDLIFNRYFRISDKAHGVTAKTGFGIGLYITKKLVEMHNGQIFVETETNKGSRFTVLLPNKQQQQSDLIITRLAAEKTADKDVSIYSRTPNFSKKDILLVAEDNEDICSLLYSLLINKYDLVFTGNGVEALNKLNMINPSLILTDIMMPEMDGVELCNRIKSDFNYCHIPIIMLTALNTGDMMINGLNAGADDYISKPFNPQVLVVRINNLIETRKNLQRKFLTDTKTEPSQLAFNAADDQFIDKLVDVIEANMENPEFCAETLASEMNMSSVTLYRKTKSLTGLSINPFVRTVRLKKAAILLQSKVYSVSEVATFVGFNDIKYFRQCFTKQFGVNPSRYK